MVSSTGWNFAQIAAYNLKPSYLHQNVFFLWSIVPSCNSSQADVYELCINTDECDLEPCKGLWGRGGRGYDRKAGGGYTIRHAACNDPQPESVRLQSCCKRTIFTSYLWFTASVCLLGWCVWTGIPHESNTIFKEVWLFNFSDKRIAIIYSNSLLTVTSVLFHSFPEKNKKGAKTLPSRTMLSNAFWYASSKSPGSKKVPLSVMPFPYPGVVPPPREYNFQALQKQKISTNQSKFRTVCLGKQINTCIYCK